MASMRSVSVDVTNVPRMARLIRAALELVEQRPDDAALFDLRACLAELGVQSHRERLAEMPEVPEIPGPVTGAAADLDALDAILTDHTTHGE